MSSSAGDTKAETLYGLNVNLLWSGFRAQGIAFWLLCTYLMLEYVRPQSIYPALDGLPLALVALIATLCAVILDGKLRWVRSPANALLVMYSVVVIASSIFATYPQASIDEFVYYFPWLVVYGLFVTIVNTEARLLMVLLLFVLFNLKMSLFATKSWIGIGFAFRDWGVGGAPGWFQNSGEFGIEMCVFFPIVVYLALGLRPHLTRWKLLFLGGAAATAIIGVLASSSRGALLGVGVVMFWMMLRSRHKVRAVLVSILVGALVLALIPPESKARFNTAGEDGSSISRLTYWTRGIEMAKQHPFLGIGYGNWIRYYAANYAPPVQVSHNIFIQAVSELGYAGLLAFLLLIGRTLALNRATRRLASRMGARGQLLYHIGFGLDGALIGFLVSGFFVTVLYYPYFWINLAMTVSAHSVTQRLSKTPRPGVPTSRSDASQPKTLAEVRSQ